MFNEYIRMIFKKYFEDELALDNNDGDNDNDDDDDDDSNHDDDHHNHDNHRCHVKRKY